VQVSVGTVLHALSWLSALYEGIMSGKAHGIAPGQEPPVKKFLTGMARSSCRDNSAQDTGRRPPPQAPF
jgi:hypothetical protein